MKWYKAFADLKDHRKRFDLEAELNTIHGLHYIHCWFSHVSKFYEDGDVSKLTAVELARACEWKGDASLLFEAFIKCEFIDRSVTGKLTAHDWFQENSRFLKENGKLKPVGNPRLTRGKTVLQDKTYNTNKTHLEPSGFVDFWLAYPRKENKGQARKMWVKHKPDLQAVLKAIEAQKQSAQWKKNDGEFIPHPSTWLNAEAWTNEITIKKPYSGPSF